MIEALLKVIVSVPVAAAVRVPAPHPLREAAVELLMVTFAGRISVTEKLVRSSSSGARKEILRRELEPAKMEAGENDLLAVTP